MAKRSKGGRKKAPKWEDSTERMVDAVDRGLGAGVNILANVNGASIACAAVRGVLRASRRARRDGRWGVQPTVDEFVGGFSEPFGS